MLVSGCGSDDGGGADGGSGALVGEDGATLVSASGKGALIVPPGALKSGAALSIADVGESLMGDEQLLSGAFELGPDGQNFLRPVTISIALPSETPASAAVVVTLNEDTGNWDTLPGSMVIGERVYAQTTHFSYYGIMIPETAVPECYEQQASGAPGDVHPLVKPDSLRVSNAMRTGMTDTSFSGANPIELGSSWEASVRVVKVTGNAGIAGEAAWIDWSRADGDSFTVDANGEFEILLDLHEQGPFFGLTDVCQAPTADPSHGWMYGLNIYCNQACLDDVPADPAAALSGLTLSGAAMLQPAFTPSILSYQLSVPFSETVLRITPTAQQSDASIVVNGSTVLSGEESGDIALALGVTPISILVTASNGDTRDYQVNVTRGAVGFAQVAYLKASNTDAGDAMGKTLALAGDTLVIGSPTEDGNGTGTTGDGNDNSTVTAGAVYVFRKTGGVWMQEAYLKASNTEPFSTSSLGDAFGASVALSSTGDRLVVGAQGERSSLIGNQTDNSFIGAGAAYVFVRSGSTWTQEAYLKASNIGTGDNFGGMVAMAGDGSTVAIAANNEDSPSAGVDGAQGDGSEGSGAVYVFTRMGANWSQQAYIKSATSNADDHFGGSVALSQSGDALAVSSTAEDGSATGVNAAVDEASLNSGAVFMFTRSVGVWSQEAYVKASNTGEGDGFGVSLDLSADGNTLAVAALFEDSDSTGPGAVPNDNSTDTGAVYVFEKSSDVWSETQFIKASNTGESDRFGTDLDLFGDKLIVGARGEDSIATGVNGDQADNSESNSGAAYIFTRTGSSWSQDSYLKASNTDQSDAFGAVVAISATKAAVAAIYEDSSATGVNGSQASGATNSGAAYVFE